MLMLINNLFILFISNYFLKHKINKGSGILNCHGDVVLKCREEDYPVIQWAWSKTHLHALYENLKLISVYYMMIFIVPSFQDMTSTVLISAKVNDTDVTDLLRSCFHRDTRSQRESERD